MPTSSKMRRKNCAPPQHLSLPRPSSARLLESMWHVFVISLSLIATTHRVAAATQLQMLINDDDLLMKSPGPIQVETYEPQSTDHKAADDPDERFNLYRSELKRLSYETIHRILRDENEPLYRREDAKLHYYQKRSNQPAAHALVRRAAAIPEVWNAGELRENALKRTHAQLQHFDAGRDYQGNHSAIYILDLSSNRLEAVNLSAFTALQQVTLANNSLSALPLSANGTALNTITTLNLNNNQIKRAAAVRSVNLRELHLSGNQITQLAHLNLSMLSSLEILDLSCNRIAELETAFFPERMHNLKHLNLAYNRIGNVYRETFYNLLSLNTLLLSHNNISDIDYETFLALPNLQYLDLSYNQLHGEAIRALQGIPDLVRLSIAYNPEVGAAMQEFVASWSLKELDASGTGLCQIPAALAQSVRTLKLTDNWLKIINCGDLDSYPLLQYLDLSHSHIEDIEDDALGRLEILETLFLDHNRLHKVPASLPTSLEHLFLQHNEIMDIQAQSFQGLNNLQTLDLSGNKLLYLPALPLRKLLTLNLRAVGLRGVSQAMVHTLPSLRDLLLDENPIKCSDLLSIAEWASPCRIVERSGDDGRSGSASTNNTDLESFSIEGNSVLGDLGEHEQHQQQRQEGDNRIGYGKDRGGQIIAISPSAVKVGQQEAQVPWTENEALVDKEAAEEQLSKRGAAKNDLKQQFVRMHNFFEKFKSNCGAQKQLAATARTTPTPTCAVELENSGEQAERIEISTAAATSNEESEITYNLPSEKSNAKTPTPTSNQQQADLFGESMNSIEGKNEDSVARRETTRRIEENTRAVSKLFKLNQKNFTAEMVGSTEVATTTLEKLAASAEATFDYKLNATQAQATRISRVNEKIPIARLFAAINTRTQKQTETQTKTATTNAAQQLKSTTPTAVPTNARQVAAGSGVATATNLLKQEITRPTKATTATTTDIKYATSEHAKSIAATTSWSTQAATPETMLVKSTSAALSVSNNGQQQQAQIPTSSINAKLAATSSLNNAREISAYHQLGQQRQQQQQRQRADDALATSQGEGEATEITTIATTADASTSLPITKYETLAQKASTAETIEMPKAILPAQTTDDNSNATTTTPTILTTQTTANTKILPIAANFLQMKRANGEIAVQTTEATFNVAATMLISNVATMEEQMVAKTKQTALRSEPKIPMDTKVVIEATTTKYIQTTQPSLSPATMQSESMAKQRVDNNLTRNDSDNDGYKVQSNKQQQRALVVVEEQQAVEQSRVTVMATTKQLARPTATQFWQQHNFKRANPYPNDIADERRPNGGQIEDDSTTEHTVDVARVAVTTTTTTTHSPPHKHEPLQLHIRDRHLIGTPLLMHRGQNMLVEAAEAEAEAEALRQMPVTTTATTPCRKAASTAMTTNDKTLAESQPTKEAVQQANSSHPFEELNEEMAKRLHMQFITHTISSNNFSNSNSERSQEEAINVETNVTPDHKIGSDDQQRPVQQTDGHADKQMLASKVMPATTATTTTQAMRVKTTAATTTTVDNINKAQQRTTAAGAGRKNDVEHKVLPQKHPDIAGAGVAGGRRKPTLIMKKMTIQTKHAEHQTQTPQQQQQLQPPSHYTLNTPRENEAVQRARNSETVSGAAHASLGKLLHEVGAHDWHAGNNERAELLHNLAQHKHSTVNTPNKRDNRADLLAALDSGRFDEQAAQEKLDAPTAQHSISSNQHLAHTLAEEHASLHEQERAAAHTQTQKWLDVRKVGPGTAHPGVVILLSFSLLAVLLIGLMHVYRCDVLPWRRRLLAHQQRPHHQRQFNAATDEDAHSFLHYHNNNGGGGEQQQRTQQPPRWHHGARSRPPYSSPLHNLHVRELQKTSAVELEAAARVTRSYYDVRPLVRTNLAARRNGSTGSSASGGSIELSRNSSSSLSSTHSSSTAAGILEADDAFYVEMTAECGQLSGANEALHCDMLPMELLTVTSTRKRNDEKDADTAVHETASLRGETDDMSAVIEVEGGKKKTKAHGSTPMATGGCGSKMRTKGATYAAQTSSTRKFDLW